MGLQIRTSTCWKRQQQSHSSSPDLSQLEIEGDLHTHVKLTDILNKHLTVFCDKVGRIKLIEHEIILKNTTPIALRPYPYPLQKQAVIDNMVHDIENFVRAT